MAGFRKAKAEQAAIKAGFYGLAGSGKTFTALLCAEGLAAHSKKRIAYVDTERGTDFYCKPVPERKVHPEAFDFDAIYTKSLTDVLGEVRRLDLNTYGVLVLDSITHLWEAAIAAYSGSQTKIGSIPMQAWGKIKKPYKELMTLLLNMPIHVIICGRQGNEWGENEDGELTKLGTKMKAEGETPHEPHILLHFEAVPDKSGARIPTCMTEKDRTGILTGKVIPYPSFNTLFKPILGLLGDTQASMQDADEVAKVDSEKLAEEESKRLAESGELLRKYGAQFEAADTIEEVESIAKKLTPDVKKRITKEHLDTLKTAWNNATQRVKGMNTNA